MKIFFEVSIREDNGKVTISNINSYHLLYDIKKILNTSVIRAYMFNKATGRELILYSFFVPDLYYVISLLIESKKHYTPITILEKVLKGLREKTFYKNAFIEHPSKLDYTQLSKLKYTPLPSQLGAFKAYDEKTQQYNLNGYLLAADVGTGKAFMGIALAAMLHSDATFVIVPKYIIESVWVNHIVDQWNNKKTYYRSDSNQVLDNNYDFYIFHYEALEKAVDFVKVYKFKNPCIILDESHNLNDTKSLRTSLYLDFCKVLNCKNIIHESGTPLKAIAAEAKPLFRAIDPLFTPKVEERFSKIYNRSASVALTILNNRLGLISHKIDKKEVMGEVQPPIIETLSITLSNYEPYTLTHLKNELVNFVRDRTQFYTDNLESYTKIYNQGLAIYQATLRTKEDFDQFKRYNEYVSIIKKGFDPITMKDMSVYCTQFEKTKIIPSLPKELKLPFKEAKSVIKYMHLKICGEFLGNVVGKRRIQLYNQLLTESDIVDIAANAEKKTICFTSYIDTLLTCDRYFKEKGFKPALIYSETNKDMISLLNKFKSDKETNPLITTFKSLGTGVTVIEANTMIFLNQPWRTIEKEQALARMYRIGQTSQTYAYDLVLDTGEEPNLSTRQMEILLWSSDQVQKMMGDNIFDITGLEEYSNPYKYYIEQKSLSFFDW